MSDITIPPEALKGAKTAFKEATNGYGTFDDFIAATCLGLLKAWPGAVTFTPHAAQWPFDAASIILPLTENINAES